MPPQGYLGGIAFGWNLIRAARGESTFSQFCRRHKVATGIAVATFVSHIYLGKP